MGLCTGADIAGVTPCPRTILSESGTRARGAVTPWDRECSVTGEQSLFLGAQGFTALLLPAHGEGGATVQGSLCWLLLHRTLSPHH